MIGPPLDDAVGLLTSEPDRILVRAARPARSWLAAIRSAPTSGDWLRVPAGLPEVGLGALLAPTSSEARLDPIWAVAAAAESNDGPSLDDAHATGDPTRPGRPRMTDRWLGSGRAVVPSIAPGAGGSAVAVALDRLAADVEAAPSQGAGPSGSREDGHEERWTGRGRPRRARTVVPFRPPGPAEVASSARALDRSAGGDSLRPIQHRIDQVLEEWVRQEAGPVLPPGSHRPKPASREPSLLSSTSDPGGRLATPRTQSPAHGTGISSTPARGAGRSPIRRLLDTPVPSWPARGPGGRPFDPRPLTPNGMASPPPDEDLALDRVIRLLERTVGGLGAIEARLSDMADAARDEASHSAEPGVHWLDEAELAGRLQRILRRQAHRRGIDLS